MSDKRQKDWKGAGEAPTENDEVEAKPEFKDDFKSTTKKGHPTVKVWSLYPHPIIIPFYGVVDTAKGKQAEVAKIVLNPGLNQVDEVLWNRIKSDKRIEMRMDEGYIKLSKPSSLEMQALSVTNRGLISHLAPGALQRDRFDKGAPVFK